MVKDEASIHFSHVASTIREIGGSRTSLGYRSSYALLGYRGKLAVDWITEDYNSRGDGPSVVQKTVKLGSTKPSVTIPSVTPQATLKQGKNYLIMDHADCRRTWALHP